MANYNLTKAEEALARTLFFDLGRDNYTTLETYLRSGQSNKDVEEYGPVRKQMKHGGKACRGRKASGSSEKAR
jgi:hypothetical protein